MKNKLAVDLKKIDEILKTIDVVRVPPRLFDDILRTCRPHKWVEFREHGIERTPGKFIKTFKHL